MYYTKTTERLQIQTTNNAFTNKLAFGAAGDISPDELKAFLNEEPKVEKENEGESEWL